MTTNNQKLIDSTQFLLAVCYREIADDNWIRRTTLGHNHFAEAVKILYNLRQNNSQQQLFQFELMKTLAKIKEFLDFLTLSGGHFTVFLQHFC